MSNHETCMGKHCIPLNTIIIDNNDMQAHVHVIIMCEILGLVTKSCISPLPTVCGRNHIMIIVYP